MSVRRSSIITSLLFAATVASSAFSSQLAHGASCTITVTSNSDSGAGSLRTAITQANSSSNADVICFNLPGSTIISPTSQLPALVQPATIDGTTQPGYTDSPIVQLAGGQAGSNSVGLWLAASNSTIRALSILNFKLNGIIITNGGSNTIVGNYVGINPQGQVGANGTDGVGVLNSPNNTIGGTTAADRNIVSGNKGNGIGVTGASASGNIITGNYVGTAPNGLSARPNNGDGILINNSPNTTIGGDNATPGGVCSGACNLVSGNQVNGVGLWYQSTTNTLTAGNYIGVDVNGASAIANGDIGLEINETANNTSGGTTAARRNVISGNAGAGIFLTGGSAHGNTVSGNYIGTGANGATRIANQKMGVGIGYSPGIQPAHDNNIGNTTNKTPGICDGGCNVISGNASNGILMSSTSGNRIGANHIGVSWNNSQFVSNTSDGIGMLDSPNNIIGGAALEGNIINGNTDNGIILAGGSSTGNRLTSNLIFGNAGAGVMIAAGVDNAILENQIAANGKLGIDIGYNNVSLNDPGDGDDGPNRYQNFPDIYSVKNTHGSYISGTLNSRPNTSYRIDFYQSDGCNAGKPNNYGEGQVYLGNLITTTDQYGNKVFTFTSPQPLAGNKYITSTATKMVGSIPAETSEFSLCRLVNTTRPAVTNGANWFLKDDLTSGNADRAFGYGFPASLLMCAWDANQNGVKLPVVYSGGSWFMRASYTTGVADNYFTYGTRYDTPVCGDWDGDGVETVGVVSGDGNWNLRNSNTSGPANMSFNYGGYGTPVVGDWDGNGNAGIGFVLFGSSLTWNLRNNLSSGPADYSFTYGGNSGRPVVGDWDGNGTSDIGAYYDGTWNVRTSLSSGGPTGSFVYGSAGFTPVSW